MGKTKSTAKGTQRAQSISIREPQSDRPHRSTADYSGTGRAKRTAAAPAVRSPETSSSSEDDPLVPVRMARGIGGIRHPPPPAEAVGGIPSTAGQSSASQTGDAAAPAPEQPFMIQYREALRTKRFNVERYADLTSIPEDSLIARVLAARQIEAWGSKGKGYKPSLVRAFYSSAQIDDQAPETIRAIVSGVPVVITVDAIAHYLGCERPSAEAVALSHATYVEMTIQAAARILCVDPRAAVGNTISTGIMHPAMSVMNKLLFSNLRARGTDSDLPLDAVRTLVEFTSEGPMDIAALIFAEMKAYTSVIPKSNMPYPQMVTHFVREAGADSTEQYLWGEGPITVRTLARAGASRRQRQAPQAQGPPEEDPAAAVDAEVEHQADIPPASQPTDSTAALLQQLLTGQQALMTRLDEHSVQLRALQRSQRALWRSVRGQPLSEADLFYFADSPPPPAPEDREEEMHAHVEERVGDEGADGADS